MIFCRTQTDRTPAARQQGSGLFQFHVPVRFADELRPAFDSRSMRSVKRIPHRSRRLMQQRHVSLLGSSIGLPGVAVDTGQHTVGPAGKASTRTRHHVVDGQFLAAGSAAAVLAHIAVSLEHVASAEGNNLDRQTIVASQRDHLGDSHCQPLSPDDRVTFGRLKQ